MTELKTNDQTTNKRKKKRAPIHWMAFFLAAALLGLVIGCTWFYRGQQRILQKAAEAQLILIAKLKANQIAAWRKERIGDAAVLMESPFLAQGVADFLADRQQGNALSLISRFRSLQTHYHYANILLVNPKGRLFLNLTGMAENYQDYSKPLMTALRERKPLLTKLYTGKQTLAPCLSVVAPIFANTIANSPPLGAIILVIDASRFLYPLIQSWPAPNKSAETLLVRRDGEDILFLNKLRHQPNAALKMRLPLSHTDIPSVMSVLGRQGLFQGKDYRGIEVLSYILPIPDSSWFMVAKLDTTEAFYHWHLRALLILALFMALAGGLAAIGLTAWQQKRHYQILYSAEAKLRESEERYHNIFDNLLEGCQLIGFNWRYLYLNDAIAKQGRNDKDKMLGRTMMEVYPDIETTNIFNVLRQCMQERKSHKLENKFVFPDGTKAWFDLFIQPVPEGLFILSTEISERKQMEFERLRFERRSQQMAKIESLSCLVGAVAHHFNNILFAVLGNLELAMEDLPPQADTAQFISQAVENVHRLVALIKKMMVFIGQFPQGNNELLDLSHVCEEHLAVLRRQIPEKVTLQTDLPRPGPVIEADQNQITQVLTNLVTNAGEAVKTPPGKILLKVEKTNDTEIEIDNRFPMVWEPSTNVYACLAITDTGCGIAANTIDQIFDPFFSNKFTGRGLGLSMVLGIVKNFNGCITVTSQLEQGSTFRVYFPLNNTPINEETT